VPHSKGRRLWLSPPIYILNIDESGDGEVCIQCEDGARFVLPNSTVLHCSRCLLVIEDNIICK
jgi:hypothetical protein